MLELFEDILNFDEHEDRQYQRYRYHTIEIEQITLPQFIWRFMQGFVAVFVYILFILSWGKLFLNFQKISAAFVLNLYLTLQENQVTQI